MKQPKYPSFYQINTRVWLTDLSREAGRPATLDDIPDNELDRIAELGFDWIWFLSVWTTGEKSRTISRENLEWQHEFKATLPDLKDEDIGGSGFAIAEYHVHPTLGGDEALKRLRERLKERDLKLMLDFVPNHMGPDHAWVKKHPDYFVQGTEEDLRQSPQNYTRIKNGKKEYIIAYGRDPYFSGWPDTLQLDYSNPATAEAMTNELLRISNQCDGVRCDMAMLILPEIFERAWGRKAQSFWPEAITVVRKQHADFCFMAEVYWDLEWTLQQIGFDYTYDKRLYDRLREGNVRAIHEHFYADITFQDKLVRFLENHDEMRAASVFPLPQLKAAMAITYLAPGLRFFHQGQLAGKTIRISPHLIRSPQEHSNDNLQHAFNILLFSTRLLTILKQPLIRDGHWSLLVCKQAWEGNDSWNEFIAFSWRGTGAERILVVVNYAPQSSQCYLRLPFTNLTGAQWRLKDLLNTVHYDRDGNDLQAGGLYLDMAPWQVHVFEIIKVPTV
jgi:hypothetical protein